MTNDYQERARLFCKAESDNLAYPLFGLYEETAELIAKTPIRYNAGFKGIMAWCVLHMLRFIGYLLGMWAKRIRKGDTKCPFDIDQYEFNCSPFSEDDCKYELGDMHWMLTNLDSQYWQKSEDVEECNIDKLTRRKNRGEIETHKDH